MKYSIVTRKYLPCSLSVFKVNGIDANSSDFVEQDMEAERTAEMSEEDVDSICRCFCVMKIPSTPEVLLKYGITQKEYDELCDVLCKELYVGACNLCL